MFTTQIMESHRGLPDRDPLQDPRHRGAIESLAQELALPLEMVATRYEALLREMLRDARVVDFLPVLVAKQLRKSTSRPADARATRLHVRILHGGAGCVRIRLPAYRDNTELLDRIERALGERGMLSRIRGNATTGSLVLELTGMHEDILARLAEQLPPGLELSCPPAAAAP
jgi:hypothetical protein